MSSKFSIRLAVESDVDQLLAIYAPYVQNTIISFEYEVPSREEFLDRIRTYSGDYPYLVCMCNDRIAGYAYASKHRTRTAYQWSAESTVYMHPEFHRRGIARILYETLFEVLRLQGYYNVYAGISLPNDQSVGFHRALGFEEVGVFKNVGFKFGHWHATHWSHRILIAPAPDPAPPKTMKQATGDDAFHKIMAAADGKVARLG